MKIADEMSLSFFETVFCHRLTVVGAEYIRNKMPHCELSLNKLQKPLNGLDIYRLGLFQSGTLPVRRRRRSATGGENEAGASTSTSRAPSASPSPSKRKRRK
jgi:hypothetical protein